MGRAGLIRWMRSQCLNLVGRQSRSQYGRGARSRLCPCMARSEQCRPAASGRLHKKSIFCTKNAPSGGFMCKARCCAGGEGAARRAARLLTTFRRGYRHVWGPTTRRTRRANGLAAHSRVSGNPEPPCRGTRCNWVPAFRVPTKIAEHSGARRMVSHRRFSWVPARGWAG